MMSLIRVKKRKVTWFYVCGIRDLTCLWSEVFDQSCCTRWDECTNVLARRICFALDCSVLGHLRRPASQWSVLVTVYKNCGLYFGLVKHICGAQHLSNSVRILLDRPSYTNLHGPKSQKTTAVIMLNVSISYDWGQTRKDQLCRR